MFNYSNKVLTKEQIREKAPSIFNTTPHPKLSDRYVVFPSENIIDNLAKLDLFPVTVKESKVTEANAQFEGTQMHTIRFRKPEFFDIGLNELAPEFVWVNSHNGRVAGKGFIGIYRKVCSNGLTVMENQYGAFRQKHVNISVGDLEESVYQFSKLSNEIFSRINDYKQVHLSKSEKIYFAKRAHESIWGEGNNMNPELLLKPKRQQDELDDLFTTFNVIQENIIKGGIAYNGGKRKTKTKGVESIEKDNKVNLLLWGMMNNVYNQKV